MVAIKNLLFIAVAVSAAVIRRDVKSLQADLTTINSDTTALDQQINSFSGGFSGAINVQNAETKLDNDIKTASSNASKDKPLNDNDAQSLINYINNTLEPNIKKTLSDLKGKKSQFASTGVQSQVHDDLVSLKSDTDAYATNLLKLAPADKQSAGKAAIAKIDADLQDAINYYS